MRKQFFLLFLFFYHGAYAKDSFQTMYIRANLIHPSCSLNAPSSLNFNNISSSDFSSGDETRYSLPFSLYIHCPSSIYSVKLMFIPQLGTVSGMTHKALTSNSSVLYLISNDLGSSFAFDSVYVQPAGEAHFRLYLSPNGNLKNGSFDTAITIQITYN